MYLYLNKRNTEMKTYQSYGSAAEWLFLGEFVGGMDVHIL